MNNKVIIIGGGIAGLSAGVYAQRCGFAATVLESHSMAGGNCTSWKLGSYLVEGGMHWLTGSSAKEPLHKLWRTVGALDDSVKISYHEPFFEYDHEGAPIRMYRDVDATEKHLLAISPSDEKAIKELCNNIRKVKNLAMPIIDIQGVKVTKKTYVPATMLFSALSGLRMMNKFSKILRSDYIDRFKHEGIRNLLRSYTNDKTGVITLFFSMGIMARGDGGFPAGGSLPFVQRIVETFTSLGGELLLNTKASRIIVENGCAVGVMVGEKRLNAAAVIVASDTMSMESLFDIPPKADWLDEMRAVTEPTMCTFVSLCINANLDKYQKNLMFKLKQQLKIAEREYEYINVNNYANDPYYSPQGKTVLTIILDGDTYDFWKKAQAENRYSEEKQKIATAIIAALSTQMPEMAETVEICDVATPLTYERYCGNWKGSWMTEMTPSIKMTTYPAVIPGIAGVYFAGQRMQPPGGLPTALASGRTAVQYLCRDTGTVFVSED